MIVGWVGLTRALNTPCLRLPGQFVVATSSQVRASSFAARPGSIVQVHGEETTHGVGTA